MSHRAWIGLLITLIGCAPLPEGAELLDLEPLDDKSASFDKHMLMSDAFFRASGMVDAAGIQQFFERTPYGGRSWLASHRLGGDSAAAYIANLAQSSNINPIVFISRMQSESSLVGPRGSLGRSTYGLGCGCPTSACGGGYSGLARQLTCAAEVFNTGMRNSEAGAAGWKLGSSRTTNDRESVRPRSHATASLYRYTPYVSSNRLLYNVTRRFLAHFQELGLVDAGIDVDSEMLDGSFVRPLFVGDSCAPECVTECEPEDLDCELGCTTPSCDYEGGFCLGSHTGDMDASASTVLVCTKDCEGYCPDRHGRAGTFCVNIGGRGRCVSVADSHNNNCADIAGTVAEERDRFVGSSGVPAARRTVCVPPDSASNPPVEPVDPIEPVEPTEPDEPVESTVASNGDPCTAAEAEVWRCVTVDYRGTHFPGSQVCRASGSGYAWQTVALNPRDCASCGPSYSSACLR